MITLGTVWPYFMQGHSYDVRPRYVLYGGLLFQPLSLDLLEAYRISDLRVRHFFDFFVIEQIYLQHPEVIVLTNILPDPINTYLVPYRDGIVDEINGKKIGTLQDLARAFEQPADRFVVNMIGDGPPLVLDPKQVEAARERIKTRYNVFSGRKSRRTAARQTRDRRARPTVDHAHACSFPHRSPRLLSRRCRRRRRPSPVENPARHAAQGAVQAKEVSLVRVNVTGQPLRLLSTVAKEGAVSRSARSAPSCRTTACWSPPTWSRTKITSNWSARNRARKPRPTWW